MVVVAEEDRWRVCPSLPSDVRLSYRPLGRTQGVEVCQESRIKMMGTVFSPSLVTLSYMHEMLWSKSIDSTQHVPRVEKKI